MLADVTAAQSRLDLITVRQREVLDLVVQHWTSKQIARELGISPNTVDQRVNAVRDKLGARDRAETVRIYLLLSNICGRTIYGPATVARPEFLGQSTVQEDDANPVFMLNDCATAAPGEWEHFNSIVFPRAQFAESRLWRLVAIVLIAAGTAVLGTTILAVMQSLNAMV